MAEWHELAPDQILSAVSELHVSTALSALSDARPHADAMIEAAFYAVGKEYISKIGANLATYGVGLKSEFNAVLYAYARDR